MLNRRDPITGYDPTGLAELCNSTSLGKASVADIPVRAEPVEAQVGSASMTAKRLLVATTALFLFLTACSPTPAQVNNAGHEPFEKAEAEVEVAPDAALAAYEEALDAYEEAQERDPEKGEPYYNAANAQYRMEAYDEALRDYDEALKYAEGDLRAQGFFNKGNVYFDEEAWPEAIESYKEVLRIQPDNEDAKHNLELALSQIPPEEEQEQGEEPEENQETGPQEQEQEQQQDQQEQQDEQNEQDRQEQENEEQQDEQEDQQQNNEQDDQQEQPQQRPQTEPITPEQARQLLETFEPQTLQERLQQVLVSPEPPPANPW